MSAVSPMAAFGDDADWARRFSRHRSEGEKPVRLGPLMEFLPAETGFPW